MPSLILEGGTFRPIFSAGVMDALLDHDLMFDYVIGVSAGITNGFSYISKQKQRNLDILLTYRHDKRYLSKRNYFKCKSIFGLNFVYEEIPQIHYPFDWDTFNAYSGQLLVGVTNINTGKSEYLNGMEIDKKSTMLKATCAIPLAFPPIQINHKYYYDGGICDPIPIRKAIQDGNTKHLIVLTQPKGYVKTCGKENQLAAKLIQKKYPKLVQPLLERHLLYNETIQFCEQLEKEKQAVILRPDHALDSFEKDLDIIRQTYEEGYQMVIDHLDEIKKLF